MISCSICDSADRLSLIHIWQTPAPGANTAAQTRRWNTSKPKSWSCATGKISIKSTFFLVRFKLCGLGGLFSGWQGGGFLVQLFLSSPLHPILTLGNAVLAAMQKVDLIEIFPVAQLHDFGFEVFHRCVCAAVLAPGAGVCWSCLLYTSQRDRKRDDGGQNQASAP